MARRFPLTRETAYVLSSRHADIADYRTVRIMNRTGRVIAVEYDAGLHHPARRDLPPGGGTVVAIDAWGGNHVEFRVHCAGARRDYVVTVTDGTTLQVAIGGSDFPAS